MVKSMAKRIGAMALAVATTVTMLAVSLAPVSAATSPSGTTYSGATATIGVGKNLSIDGAKFPDIDIYQFELERVEAAKNDAVGTTEDPVKTSGTIAKSDIPMPGGATTDKVTVDVSGFKGSASGDTATNKLRTNAFPAITYTQAGWYKYRLHETGSKKDSSSNVRTDVPGAIYDDDVYWVLVYVKHTTDNEGNTQDGVEVANVTLWRGNGADPTGPNLSDIDVTTDNNGQQAITIGEDTYGKVNDGKFWNSQIMRDVKIQKNVKGDLGDRTKEFEFTVTLTGLEASNSYAIQTEGTPTLVSASKGTLDGTANTITADASGAATFLVKLKDDDAINIVDLPVTAKYSVSEAASNHVASYAITGNGTQPVIVKNADECAAKETALATSEETIDAADGDVTILYTNTRDIETTTGVPYADEMLAVALMGIASAFAAFAVRRRRSDNGAASL